MKRAETHPRRDLKYFSSMNNRVTSGDVDLSEEMVNIDVNTLYTYLHIF